MPVCSHSPQFVTRHLPCVSRAVIERSYLDGGCSAAPQQLVHDQLAVSMQHSRPDLVVSGEQMEMLAKRAQAAVFRPTAQRGDSEWLLLRDAANRLSVASEVGLFACCSVFEWNLFTKLLVSAWFAFHDAFVARYTHHLLHHRVAHQ